MFTVVLSCSWKQLHNDHILRCAWPTNKAHFSQVQNALFCGAYQKYPWCFLGYMHILYRLILAYMLSGALLYLQ